MSPHSSSLPEPPPSLGQPVPPCPDCGGDRVGPLELTAGPTKTGVWPIGRRRAFGVTRVSDLVGYACLKCGYLQTYVYDLEALRKAVEKHPDRFGR